MARRKRRIVENVHVFDIADKGKAVGKDSEGQIIFIDNTVPGDVVDVQLLRKRKKVWQGTPVKFHKYSEDRVSSFCEHFNVCGGCKWQHLDYDAQLRHKQNQVEAALKRIGKVDIPEILPISGADETKYYRNKLEFTFSNRRWITEEEVAEGKPIEQYNALGFHRAGNYAKIVDIEHCYLQAEPSNSIRNHIRKFALQNDFEFFDIKEQVGFLRNVIIRTASTGDVMVIVAFYQEKESERIALLDSLKQQFSQITSLMYVINPKGNDTIYDLKVHSFAGNPYLIEKLGDTKYQIGPKSFFQTNTTQAKTLYDIALDFADLKGTENLYDLYTGIGSIACYAASHCKQVVGIEEIAPAIEDARINAKLNNLDNTVFYAGDVKRILSEEFAKKHGKPDIIITDPPRVGMHTDVVNMLLELESPRIVYISCNPSTQARDIQLLSAKYKVLKSQAVDMFPHTHHIENVVLLSME